MKRPLSRHEIVQGLATLAAAFLLLGMTLRVLALQQSGVYGSEPAPGLPALVASPSPVSALAPTTETAHTPATPSRAFQAGVAFPRWGSTGYSAADAGWSQEIGRLRRDSNASWIEMTFDLYVDTQTSLVVHTTAASVTPENLARGIAQAHRAGLRVFVAPLLGVLTGPEPWGGAIRLGPAAQQPWFESYWQALRPYAQVAADANADQFAVATELSGLESASPDIWQRLITRVRGIYSGPLTYDLNFSTLALEPTLWMRSPDIAYLGISEYQSLVDTPSRLDTDHIAQLWQDRIIPSLRGLFERSGKPVLLTELGYRDAFDALYQPWVHQTTSRPDPTLQAAAYEAALRVTIATPWIAGTYFWAWYVGQFTPHGRPAATMLRAYYGPLDPPRPVLRPGDGPLG
ncbi:MAG TPA: hypothetical protein VF807_15695 [Ktedonobacterales bacterium]